MVDNNINLFNQTFFPVTSSLSEMEIHNVSNYPKLEHCLKELLFPWNFGYP